MSLTALFVLCRFMHFASLMQIFGLSVLCSLLTPAGFSAVLLRKNQTLMICSALVAAVTSVGMLAIQAALMGNGWGDALNLNVWLLVLTTAFGDVWRWHLLLTAALLLMLLMDWLPARNMLVFLCSCGLLMSQALVGHAAMHEGTLGLIQRTNHVVHLLSAAYWFGCLLPLLTCMAYTRQLALRPYAIATLIRFSVWGHAAVVLVILTGIVNTAIILQRWPTDMTSLYQCLLVVKVLMVGMMVTVAVFNRYRLVPLMAKDPERAQHYFVMMTWLEWGLALGVLLLVSVFATLAPR
ncbi:copper resistance protein D [Rahnella aquatilis CIP 78.65 = ATCC 33071]|uniref:Copper resistance protein D n=1 Tax=Rahnella aquatilis (strain ATCC 33071 / DSM 4594 / JCM 1683 / NBRC 105701 / NCIMB 13365 / CIP 78.65) TaxID=745277 RepID=H2IU08_RAHAC|nr:copper homeostasis membrane protein CopD [Rahnella aquatilis]AEX52732.1 putative copper export protein [Rahnella aquatilis CIP 78.65 = ATCC 33071]KFD05287.1 copper resistance protein D [Rahnella aquatilis CIP 78.65 = ATCC 33071]